MRDSLWLAAEAAGGILIRPEALAIAGEHVVEDMLVDGLSVRPFPETYVVSHRAGDRDVLRRAALRYRNHVRSARSRPFRPTALSHLDGLDVSGLPCPALPVAGPGAIPIHVSEAPGPAIRVDGIEVHRRTRYNVMPIFEQSSGLVVVSKEQAIVESWPLLPVVDRRTPLIVGIRDHRVRPEAITAILDINSNTPGSREMREVASLVAGGLHSHLELWGHAHVFSDPRLPKARTQHPIRLHNGNKIYLDRYYPDLLLNIELDGAAYHGLPGQRERDLRRDAALAALGIQVVRFSHQRLHFETEAVIAELLEICAVRRRLLAVS